MQLVDMGDLISNFNQILITYYSSCLRAVERFDPLKNRWEQLPSMNEPRRALSAVALPDGVYAIGGYNGKEYLDTVEKYDEKLG